MSSPAADSRAAANALKLSSALGNLTSWTDPVASATTLLAGNAVFAMGVLWQWSLAGAAGAAAFYALLASLLCGVARMMLGGRLGGALGERLVPRLDELGRAARAVVPPALLADEPLDVGTFELASNLAASGLNGAWRLARRAASLSDPPLTIGALLGTLLLKLLGPTLGVGGLAWLGFVLAFTPPAVRELASAVGVEVRLALEPLLQLIPEHHAPDPEDLDDLPDENGIDE